MLQCVPKPLQCHKLSKMAGDGSELTVLRSFYKYLRVCHSTRRLLMIQKHTPGLLYTYRLFFDLNLFLNRKDSGRSEEEVSFIKEALQFVARASPFKMAALLDTHEGMVGSPLRVELSHAVSPQGGIIATSAEPSATASSYNVVSLGSAGTLRFNSAVVTAAQGLEGTDTAMVLSDTTPITVASLRGPDATRDSAAAIDGNAPDLTHVLTGLHRSEELTSVLQQQPHLVQGMVNSCIE